jgi:hypothetical protein
MQPKPGWGAIVEGEPTDVEDWQYALKEPFEPWVETHDGKTVLRSVSLDELASANEVRDRALALIARLNGAFAVSQQTRPLRFGGVIQFTPDGERHQTVFGGMAAFEGRDKMRTEGFVIGLDGNPAPPSPPQPSEVQRWVATAEEDELLDDAIVHFGKGADWFEMYKALECLENKAGGLHAFLALNWQPKEEIERLKYSANWPRHARRKEDRPARLLMNPNDARALLAQMLRRALHEWP